MIISASRRTDIPAFFGHWFAERVRAGWVDIKNPFNPKQVRRVSLLPEDVDAFVFWTKNPAPFRGLLDGLDRRGFCYYFQFTINAYDRDLEPNLPAMKERLETFFRLSDRLGPERVIWRYDPIVLSNRTPAEFHLKSFDGLSRALQGRTRRVVISLAEYYRKTNRRLRALEADGVRFDRQAADRPRTIDLLRRLRQAADARGIQMESCACAFDLSPAGIRPSACVDAQLIRALWGADVPSTGDPGQREHCRCAISRDIGTNSTCAHGCLYCYANR